MNKIASFFSWLFLPIFTPIYGLLVILYLPVPSNSFLTNDSLYLLNPTAKILFLSLFLIFIVLGPGISFFVMRMNKNIKSYQMKTAAERLMPIALMTFYFIVLFFFLYMQAEGAVIPDIIKGMVLGGIVVGALAYFITPKIKISLHSIGMGALFGFVYMFSKGLEQPPLILLTTVLLLGGIVMSSRLALKAHTLKEVGLGYLLGLLTQMFCIWIYT